MLRISLELTQMKQEIERALGQKEDEFAATRKNFTRALDGEISPIISLSNN